MGARRASLQIVIIVSDGHIVEDREVVRRHVTRAQKNWQLLVFVVLVRGGAAMGGGNFRTQIAFESCCVGVFFCAWHTFDKVGFPFASQRRFTTLPLPSMSSRQKYGRHDSGDEYNKQSSLR